MGAEMLQVEAKPALPMEVGCNGYDDDSNKPEAKMDRTVQPPQSLGDEPVPFIGIPIKWFVLLFLVVQNSAAALLMRYSRSNPGEKEWNPQTGVIMQEVIKGVSCMFLLLKDEGGLGSIYRDRVEFLKAGIPAIFYLVQNNMQYVAISHLSATTYAVLFQLKILTTAVLSVLMLGKRLSLTQWIALGLLTVGVSCVTLSQISAKHTNGEGNAGLIPAVMAVLLAATMSGLAGVYFEKILKGSKISLWTRNMQLALHSIVIGFSVLYIEEDSGTILKKGFFHGYTPYAWLAIANNAFGGLLIAMVIKYTDNIMKNFSQGLSIIFTALFSCFAFESSVGFLFWSGVNLVVYSIFLYNKIDKK